MDKSDIAKLTTLQVFFLSWYVKFLLLMSRFFTALGIYKIARKFSFRVWLTRFHFLVWVDFVQCDELIEQKAGD